MKKGRIHFGIGMISIFMVFVVVCFTIITALTYIKASDQEELSIKHVEHTREYYVADGKARNIQGQLEYLSKDIKELVAYCLQENISKDNDTYQYYVDINNKQQLEVTIYLTSLDSHVLSWKTISK